MNSDIIFWIRYNLARFSKLLIKSKDARRREIAKILYPQYDAAEALMRLEYRRDAGKELDLKNPRDFSAKLHWLKKFYHCPQHGRLVDKYAVRDYVAEKIGTQYLNKIYGVYLSPDDIDLASLPEQFVIKGAHGYNMNLICRDKAQLCWPKEKERLRKWLATRHELMHAETAYAYALARLLVEEFIVQEDGDLNDYKFFCFNGEPEFFKVDRGRATFRYQTYYDLKGSPMPFFNPHFERLQQDEKLPTNFDTMLEICRKLGHNLPFARIDLYNLAGDIRFGEITLSPSGGNLWVEPREWNNIIGDMLHLPTNSTEI